MCKLGGALYWSYLAWVSGSWQQKQQQPPTPAPPPPGPQTFTRICGVIIAANIEQMKLFQTDLASGYMVLKNRL
jgi:hypothetical protein